MAEKIPAHLKHKPIYVVDNYPAMDGEYKHDTDVHGISLGKAQWSSEKFVASVKVWRKKNGRWSRQSEETTLTRALDLAALVIKIYDAYTHDRPVRSWHTVFDDVKIEECTTYSDPAMLTHLKNELAQYFEAHQGDIESHIDLLYQTIQEYKK